MIKMFHVTKRYEQEYVALSDLTLHIPKGEFAFVTGPSGAGKSTLLKLLIKEEVVTSGQIIVNGRNFATVPDHQIPLLRRNMGFVFQDFKLLKRKTVYENVTFVLHVIGVSTKIQRRRAFEILKMVGLQHKMHSYPLQLSGGEQQRVAIARALINEPVLLMADEPTG
ncbi:MAG TPA: ATP-binding cassette domain-containing protein, partial [Acidobacteriota bacterium]